MVMVPLVQPGQAVDGPHKEQNRPALGSSGWSRQVGNASQEGKPGKFPAGVQAPLKLHPHRAPQTGPIKAPGVQPIPWTPEPQTE
jgi:hypothetical protein